MVFELFLAFVVGAFFGSVISDAQHEKAMHASKSDDSEKSS